jgi:hypothetical protein
VAGTLKVSPLAFPDAYNAIKNIVNHVNAPGVLTNDKGFPTPTAVPIAGGATTHGTVTLNADGSFDYTPANGYTGPDTFNYTVTNTQPPNDTATVTVTVANGVPTITDTKPAAVTMSEDGSPTAFSLTLNATDADNDTITWSISGAASHGTATATGPGTSKSIGYTPNANYKGSDSFTVRVDDGNGGSDTIVVNVTINSVNDAPTITDSKPASVTMSEDGSPTAFSLTLNASDADVDPITWSISSAASNGTATASGLGGSKSIGYAPNPNYNGSDSFTVKVEDGNGGSDTIVVNVTINAVNDAPVVDLNGASTGGINVAATFTEDAGPIVIAPLAEVSDVDNANLQSATITLTNRPDGDLFESLSVDTTGTSIVALPYIPLTGVITLTGADTVAHYQQVLRTAKYDNTSQNPSATARLVNFKANDGTVDSTTAVATGAVAAVNDAPVNTVPGAQTVNEDTDLTFSAANSNALLIADSDAGASAVKLSLDVVHGTITFASTVGLTFVDSTSNGTGSVHVTGTIPAINAALVGLKYKGTANYNVSRGAETLTMITNDQGNTGPPGAKLDTDTVSISVTAISDAPTAIDHTYGPGAVHTNIKMVGLTGLLAGATDPDTGDGGYTASFSVASVSATNPAGGTVTVTDASAGTFDFDPPAGVTGDVTFTYTITDSGNPGAQTSPPATVTVNVTGPVIWFADDSAAAGGTGTLASPFQTLAVANTAALTGQSIFLFDGNYTGGVTLAGSVRLFGQGVKGTSFDSVLGISPPAGSLARPSINSGTPPVITTVAASTNGINLGSGNTIRGLTIGNTTGAKIFGSGFGTLTVGNSSLPDVTLNGTGKALDLTTGTFAATSKLISLTTTSSATEGIELVSVTGTVAFGSTAVSNSTSAGISVTTSSADINFGNTNVSSSAGTGVLLSNNTGDMTFADLDISPDSNQRGLLISNTAVGPYGTVTATSGTISALLANAAEVVGLNTSNRQQVAMLLDGVSSTGGTNNILLTNVSGSFLVNGGAVSGATLAAVKVDGSTATVSYAGSVTNTTGGISLTNNATGTINFTGALSLSTGANTAFTATGGGTVQITGAANTLTTTTGTALNIANTTIGASGVKFQSINATSASANRGIILNNTGSGALLVTGTGSTAGTGGTISNKTGNGVDLRTASNITLKNMTLTGNGTAQTVAGSAGTCGGNLLTGDNLSCVANLFLQAVTGITLTNVDVTNSGQIGINGNDVTTFTMSDSAVTGNGNESSENGLTFQNLKGTCSITDTIIRDNVVGQMAVANIANGSTLTLSITGTRTNNGYPTQDTSTTMIGRTSPAAAGEAGILFNTLNTSTNVNMTLNLTGVVFNNNYPANAAFLNMNSASGSLGGTTTNCSFDTDGGGVIIQAQNGQGGTYNITNSEFYRTANQHILYSGLNPFNATLQGTVQGNTIGSAADSGSACYPTSGANCVGIDINLIGGNSAGAIRTKIGGTGGGQPNTIQQFDQAGIRFAGNGSGSVESNIQNNTIQNPLGLSAKGIDTNIDTTNSEVPVENTFGCFNITGNTITGAYTDPGVGTQFGIHTRVRNNGTHKLPGYLGGANDDTAAANYIKANNPGAGGKVYCESPAVGTAYAGGGACTTPLLFAEGGVQAKSLAGNEGRLTKPALDSTVAKAMRHWEAAGLTAEQIATLRALTFEVADLPGQYLGEASGNHIRLSRNAGGNGWFISAAKNDEQFGKSVSATRSYTDPASAPAGRVDLLTAIMHEMGHTLGLPDSYDAKDRDKVMYGFLTTGERRVPATGDAVGAKPNAQTTPQFLASPAVSDKYTIGDIPPGKTVVVTFQVQVENPLSPANTTQISNQGTVKGTNLVADVLTDDPNVGGAADPTITLLCANPATVTTNADAGAGSLRQALIDVCADGTITFSNTTAGGAVNFYDGNPHTITLASELVVDKNVTINGPGANVLTVGGNNTFRLVNITLPASGTATIQGLSFTGGRADPGGAGTNGGAIEFNSVGTLNLNNCEFFANTKTAAGDVIFSSAAARLNINGCTFRNNTTEVVIHLGSTPATIVNSTISNNTALAVRADGGPAVGVTNCTIANNSVGGIGLAPGGGGTVTLTNTILSQNNGNDLTRTDADCSGNQKFNSGGHNLIDDATSSKLCNSPQPGDLLGAAFDPLLGSLAGNGGPTQTCLPALGSQVINAAADWTTLSSNIDNVQTTITVADPSGIAVGSTIRIDLEQMSVTAVVSNTLTVTRGANATTAAAHTSGAGVSSAFDQRGFPRKVGSAVDIGAVETNYTITTTAGTPQSTKVNTAFPVALQATVKESGTALSGVSVTFTPPASNVASGTFTGGTPATVSTNGSGVATAPTFTANAIAGGPYIVAASVTGLASTADFSLTNTPPTVTIDQASGQGDPTAASPINFTVVFSDPVTGFGSGGVTLSGTANPTTAVVTGSGTTYNVAVSGMTAQPGTVIATVNAGAATDGGGNANLASTSTDNTVTYDTPPSVTINQASGQADPTNASPINFTVVFSEAVTGFGSGGVDLSGTANPTTAVVTGSGTTYNVAVSGMSAQGTVIASVKAGAATDSGSYPNTASTSTDNTVTYDSLPPTVTINQASGQADPTNISPINFTVVFSEAVTGFGSGSVTLSGTAGATTKVVTGSGNTYNVAVSGMTSDGTVIATVPAGGAADAAGNTNAASTSADNIVTYDTTKPDVTINQASGQADPASASPINFTVVFTESVTGFGSGGVTLAGTAGATTAVVTGSGTTYNVAVSGMTSDGTVIAAVTAGGAADAAGNTNNASSSTDNTVTYDVTNPSVTINQASGQTDPTNASPINFTVVFSETVTGFGSGGVTLSGAANPTTAVVTGSGTTYNVAVSGMSAQGTVIASVKAGAAIDSGSNPNTASTSTDNTVTYDSVKPAVMINQASSQADPTNASPINFTVVFSEAVTGFGSGSVTLSGTAGATTKVVTGSGNTYNVAVNGMTSDGTVIATVPAGGAADAAGNTNAASTSADNTVTYDTTKPDVTINQASGQADPAGASPINFTVVFTESVTGFGSGSVTLSGTAGATTKVVTGSGTTYNVAVSGMTSDGTVIATTPAGGAADAAGNTNSASSSTDNTVTYDGTKPSVTINQASGQADPANASPINFTVVFTESVTGFGSGSVTLSGTAGATTKVVTGSGTTYNVAVSGMTSDGTVIATVPAGGATDASGNTNTVSTSTDNTVTYDTLKPAVMINQASTQADPTNASSINFTVVFSEAVTGFGSGSVTLSGTAGATTKVVTGSGTTYNVAVGGMTSDGTVIATVPAGGAADAAGNTNAASTSADNTVTYDTTKPDVTINQASGQADPTNASPINFTVVFTESVTGFGSGSVTLSGTAGATTKVVTGSGTTYNVAVSGMTSNGTVIATVPAGGAADAAGNTNNVSSSTDNTVTYDGTKPGVTIDQASGQADPTNASPINFTVVFSEAVTGFTGSGVSLSGTAGATNKVVTGSGTTYNVAVSGMTSQGTVIATVAAGSAADTAGNTNTASSSTDNTVTYDDVQPSVTINQASGQTDPTNASPINFTVVFSESVTGFGSGSVTLSGTAGATTKVVTGSGTTYNVAVSGMTSNGTVIATVPAGGAADAAGNTNTVSTSTDNSVNFDSTQPSVTINQAAAQSDPANASPINFTIVFSKPVTGFGSSGVNLSGTAGATTKVVTGSGATYNVAVSGMTSDGTVIATVPAGSAADSANNTNTASTSTDNTVTYDTGNPSVTINQASGQVDPTNASPINFTVVFSEVVTGFGSSGVTLSGTAGATSKVVTGSGTTYNVAVSGMTSQGTVIASVATGAAADGAGNTNNTSTSTDNTVTYDNVQPSVTINQASTQSDPTNASPINFTVVFSESVTGFSASGVTLSGTAGATSKVVTGSGTTYNVAVSGMTSQGTVIATVPAGGAVDGAGNANGVSTSTDNTVTYDNVQPSVTINQASGQADPTTSSPINFTVVFSEPVSGFGSSGVTLSGTAGATAKVVTGSGTTYNVAVSGMTSQGTVTATVPAGGATDAAGNTSTASTSTDNTVTFNTLATHFTVTAPASAIPGTSFTFTVTALDQFNNPPTSYPGTVHFSSTDAAGILPVDSTLSGGTGTFNATLKTPGSQTITATDTGNSSISGTSNAIAVGKTNPTISTQASTGINLGAGTISDAATLAGGSSPMGSITFRLYGPNDATCGSAAVFTSAAIPVSGNATYSSGNFTPTAPGTYRWIASYSGDTANNAVSGACNDANESVVVTKANPAITGTVAPATGNIGTSFTDTATLSAGTNPTGTITFTVHGPNTENCATPIFTSTRTVAGNANYTSDAFTPTLPGSYKFLAVYNGDANNNSVATICGAASQTFVVNGPPPSPTPTPTATPAQALNISTRMRTELGDKAMIGGFIITGNASKSVVLRGLGPSLSSFGLSDLLLDPELELRGPNNNLIFKNKNWKDDQRSQIEGTNFEPKDDRESVIVITLNAGAYTALLTGKDGTEGIGLVEIYDTNPAAASELGNISTRGMVRTDDKVMIGGFTLGGPNNATRIAVRGRGPSLSQFNLSPLLANPVLELRNENGTIMVVNDDWQSDPVSAANLTANGLGLSDPKESGIFISLTPPGQFTAILSGKDGGIGIGLVEIYNLK